MARYLLISGSPRPGNSEFILNNIFAGINSSEKELLLLRDKKISHCQGCLYCEEHQACSVRDDMQRIYDRLQAADIIVFATPNYYDNVPGIAKDFIDRLNPFYDTDAIRGKKILNIVVGGAAAEKSQRMIDGPLSYFEQLQGLDVINSYYFEGLKIGAVENNKDNILIIGKIIRELNSLDV